MGQLPVSFAPLAAVTLLVADVFAGSLRDPQFDLATWVQGPLRVHYEKALEPHVDQMLKALDQYLEAEAREVAQVRQVASRAEHIAERVGKILGSPLPEGGGTLLQRFLRPGVNLGDPAGEPHLFIMRESTIKEYLRAGQTIPHFDYVAEHDAIHYRFDIAAAAEEGTFDHVVLVVDAEPVATQIRNGLVPLLPFPRISLAVHELVEVNLLFHCRPKGPYFRWFSDGFANAITEVVLREELGDESADWFMRAYDPQRFAAIKDQINLLYWMGVSYEIDLPVDAERRLEMARYTFATVEAKRIVEKHGIEVVQAIMKRIVADGPPDWKDILRAVEEVTGEDIEHELKQYQRFDGRDQGLSQSADAYRTAMLDRRMDDAIFYAKRIMELRRNLNLKVYARIALLLRQVGYDRAGDRVFLKLFEQLKNPQPLLELRMLFVDYAIQTEQMSKAYGQAEQVLQDQPAFVPALCVRMDQQAAASRWAEARRTAERVLELRQDESDPYHRLARRVMERMDGQRLEEDVDG